MTLASFVVIALLNLLPGRADLTGTWRLDGIRSDFGAADSPQLLVLRLEQSGNRFAATTFIADRTGKRVIYQECRIETHPDNHLSCVIPDGPAANEVWRLTAPDELTVTRALTARLPIVRQRLVLMRSTPLE